MSSKQSSEQRQDARTPGGKNDQADDAPVSTDEAADGRPADAESVPDSQDAGRDLSLDLVFEILKNSRRREVLRYLKDRREQVTLSELAEHVAAIENDTTVQALSSQQRKRVYVGLYQCHLPKLDDMDIVQFNQSRGHVELGPNASQLDKYLYMDEDADDERPWYQYYLGFSALGAVVLFAVAGTGVLGSIGTLTVSVTVVLGVAALAGLHAYDRVHRTDGGS